LNNNLDINGTHTFVSGIITTSATPNYLIYEAGTSYSGDGNTAHVNGWVKKFGNTNFAFPVGNGTVERPVSITSLSASSEFNARHNITTPNSTTMQSPIVSVDPYEYWTINQVSGGTAQILMNWDNSKINFPGYIVADIRAVYNNAGTWINRNGTASGTAGTTGTITSSAVASFGSFTFGSITVPLPLSFLSVFGLAEQTYNVIQWKTTQEINIDHFEVQRSSDGVTFNNIGQEAPGNNNSQTYVFTDRQPLPGVSWYRIKSMDIDGTPKYSTIVRINPFYRGNSFYVINNPVSGTINLAVAEKYKGNYKYQLLNTVGQVIQKGNLSINQGGIFSIPITSQLIRGTYVFQLFNSSYTLVDRVYIQ
jgi:hypothetical protein